MAILSRAIAVLALAVVVSAHPLHAQTRTRVVYKQKSWQVQVVAFDGGDAACVAQVLEGRVAFSIWADGRTPARLQFFSPDWKSARGRVDMIAQIDGQARWVLKNAEQFQGSVLFELPSDEDGARFLREVASGRRLDLMGKNGAPVARWTLAGSGASVQALNDCAAALNRARRTGN